MDVNGKWKRYNRRQNGRILFKKQKNLVKENSKIKVEILRVIKESEIKLQQQKTAGKKKFQDKADLVDILEHTLENKTSEIERVKGELEKIKKQRKWWVNNQNERYYSW